MSGAEQMDGALLALDLGAHRARPVADVLFYLGGAVVAASLLLMVVGPWIVPFDVGRPSDEIMQPPPALADVPSLLMQVISGTP
ncbi:MAG: hypothetical protein EOO78_31850, partial [Oxalobacteraceae bacterium]